jgi:UDP-N-acetylmuramoyl-tripeptide--D-alanyl-D-alanine ligase
MKQTIKVFVIKVLIWEAKAVLKKYRPKIVAITGSVGKTSTKDAIYTVFSSAYTTRKSEKSYNGDVGVALTILGAESGFSNIFVWIKNMVEGFLLFALPHSYPAWLILEVGTNTPGDIETITHWLKPDVTVITRFGDVPVHVEFFPSIDDLIREKGYLAHALKPDGVLIFNHDDNRVRDFSESIQRTKITYGFEPGADIGATDSFVLYGKYDNSELEFPTGVAFTIMHQGAAIPLFLNGALGKQHIYPMLAAFATGISQNIPAEKIAVALSSHITASGRMKLLPGIKDTLLIDDSYNSSPVAVDEALKTLSLVKASGRKIAVLGDMLELGSYSIEEHKRVGQMAKDATNILVTVGIRSRATADAALDAGINENNVLQFETSQEAGKYLQTIIKAGDILLIKGSQSMRMERIVKELMRFPEKAEEQLVRQEQSWQVKK